MRVWFALFAYLSCALFTATRTLETLAKSLPAGVSSDRRVEVRVALFLGATLMPFRALTGAIVTALLVRWVLRSLGTRIEWLTSFKAAVAAGFAATLAEAIVAIASSGSGNWLSMLVFTAISPLDLSNQSRAIVGFAGTFASPSSVAFGIGALWAIRRDDSVSRPAAVITMLAVMTAQTAGMMMLARAIAG